MGVGFVLRRGSHFRFGLSTAVAAFFLAGCTLGPKYVRPSADVPANYKESASFTAAQPGDAIAKGKWWEVYQDPQLNSLEEQIAVSNQTLKAAQAQFLQARAAVRVSRSSLYPTATGQPGDLTHRAIDQ